MNENKECELQTIINIEDINKKNSFSEKITKERINENYIVIGFSILTMLVLFVGSYQISQLNYSCAVEFTQTCNHLIAFLDGVKKYAPIMCLGAYTLLTSQIVMMGKDIKKCKQLLKNKFNFFQ